MITAIPALAPVTIPDEEPTVATAMGLDVHTPPAGLPVSVMDDPTQTLVGPVITGVGSTVNSIEAKQPVDSV